MAYPPSHIVDPQPGHLHSHTVILLHGRSSTAQEFANDLFSLRTSNYGENLRSIFPGFRWVFPDAGERWCTPFREKRSAWCDTYSLEDLSLRQDLQVIGLRDGVLFIKNIIEEETAKLGGSSEQIILGGFSQGSATSLWSLFTGAAATKGRLGGFVGLSAWMPFTREAGLASKGENETQSQALLARIENLMGTFLDILGLDTIVPTSAVRHCLQGLPVFLGHGIDDVPVSIKNCRELSAIFRGLEVDLVVREYVGAAREGHWLKEPEELDDLVEFIKSRARNKQL